MILLNKCICNRCKKEFKPYDYYEECYSCDDGSYDDSDGDCVMCPFCGGKGGTNVIKKECCKSCKEYLEYNEDED